MSLSIKSAFVGSIITAELLGIFDNLLFTKLLFKKETSRTGDWKYSGIDQDQHLLNSPWVKPLRRFLLCLNIMAISFLIIALAKPYHSYNQDATDEEFKNGIDIILAMDVSVSMLAMDFEPNRLEAANLRASVGTTGDSYDNALAETVNGLYKT